MIVVVFAIVGFVVSLAVARMLIPELARIGMTGADENKAGGPRVPEMGGLAILAGFGVAALAAVFYSTFIDGSADAVIILSVLAAVLIVGVVGVADDLFGLPQKTKALLPALAAVPLIAMRVGFTSMNVPFFGMVDFGLVYVFVFVPLAVAACSNLTNMVAGFNGLEAGLGAMALVVLGVLVQSPEAQAIAFSMAGALAGFCVLNAYPARVFPGDVGTLPIGTAIAAVVILGNIEAAGVMVMALYMVDFVLKAVNGFPHTNQELRGGLLFPKGGRVVAVAQVPMALLGGIGERDLVRLLLCLQFVVCVGAVLVALFVF